ncbi:MAG: DUF697 domain-containing protein [Acidobacteriota bacterium]|nr:DUF697 domain-containing protein [Acidobacteriota bacterium]
MTDIDKGTTVGEIQDKVQGETPSEKLIRKHMLWALGASILPFPVLDLAAITAVEVKMVRDISRMYGVDWKEERGKAVVGALLAGVLPHPLSFSALGSLIKAVPIIGPFIGGVSVPIFAAGLTWALGRVFVMHFESGGTLLTFNPDRVREHFHASVEEGKRVASDMLGRHNPLAT